MRQSAGVASSSARGVSQAPPLCGTVPQQPLRGGKCLRNQRHRVFKADLRTSPYSIRFDVLRPPTAGLDPNLLFEFRKLARSVACGRTPEAASQTATAEVSQASSSHAVVAVGLRAAASAVDRGHASAVLVCGGDCVSSGLMQHLPIMCSLRAVPVAILAASPRALGLAVAPLRDAQRRRREVSHGGIVRSGGKQQGRRALTAVAVAILQQGCEAHDDLREYVSGLSRSVPKIKLPFLIPTGGAPPCAPLRFLQDSAHELAQVTEGAAGLGSKPLPAIIRVGSGNAAKISRRLRKPQTPRQQQKHQQQQPQQQQQQKQQQWQEQQQQHHSFYEWSTSALSDLRLQPL
eukprot:TRINITY_DN11482_c1_g2_i1.p1 TRINITY_DN11482_c1_g2~~TRINITY_DN11482_c1_g2_i1.p1  ORF type:complete len:347 (-),score=69.35 TRINITY_DN11482_c1_g2_i1:1064-2104(-)